MESVLLTSKGPTLQLEITKENYQTAVEASSGGCLIADAIKRQYPEYTHVYVDVATTRVTDRKRGERYIYLTPPSAGEYLLAFDQGWKEDSFPKKVRYRAPVKILPIARSISDIKLKAERRAERLTKLEAKEKAGKPLSQSEKTTLTRLRNPKPTPERPVKYGATEVEVKGTEVITRGGRQSGKLNRRHANMLHGQQRHFGAKSAEPSEVFKKAVREAEKAAVKRYKAKQDKAKS